MIASRFIGERHGGGFPHSRCVSRETVTERHLLHLTMWELDSLRLGQELPNSRIHHWLTVYRFTMDGEARDPLAVSRWCQASSHDDSTSPLSGLRYSMDSL